MARYRFERLNLKCIAILPAVATALVVAPTAGSLHGGTAVETAPWQTLAAARVRVATFNIEELTTAQLTEIDAAGVGQDPQARAAAEIIQRVRPDVLVLNEIDHDYDALDEGLDLNARRFVDAYLRTGTAPIDYPYAFAAPNNTGIPSGLDLDNDGRAATRGERGTEAYGNDSFGFGTYPGQYSLALLSRHPILESEVRTFQRFLWKDLRGHHLPENYYSDEAVAALRLSSKSHWDVPVQVDGHVVHLFISHPTPSVFDSDEDRNGRRNFDEIRFWVVYLENDAAIYDDDGVVGGYAGNDPFVILGDLNARPDQDESSYDGMRAINQLLNHPRIQDSGATATTGGAPHGHTAGPPNVPARATAEFLGGVRVDYVLPSIDLDIIDGGVFWPDPEQDPGGARLAEQASDHRLVWLDLGVG